MTQQRDIPYRSGTSDVASLLVLILFVALALQFYSKVTELAPLRDNGMVIEGQWVDRYREPQTGEYTAIYKFELGNNIYRGRQTVSEEMYSGDGQTVSIVYAADNPDLSRIQGTDQIVITDLVMLIASIAVVILAIQHIIAYYLQRASWSLFMRRKVVSMWGGVLQNKQ